jgi:hypothetical protein
MVMSSSSYRYPSSLDRKTMLAQMLLQQSQNKQATTPIGGIDKIASMALAGLMMGQGMQEQKDNEAFDQKTMAEAMKQMTPQTVQGEAPGPMMDGTAGYQMDRTVPGDVNRGMQTLAQSPRLAGMAQQQMLANLLKGEERAANRKDQMDLYNMQDQDRWTQLRFARENALEDRTRSEGHAEKMARLQAQLTAGNRQPPADAQLYEFAKRNGFTGTFMEFMNQKSQQGGAETFGNTLIWGTGEDGRPVLMQPSNRGGLKVVPIPEGVTPQRGQTQRVDLGDRFAILDATGTVIGYQPKGIGPERKIDDGRVVTLPAVPGPALIPGDPPVMPNAAAPPQPGAPAQPQPPAPTVTNLPPTQKQIQDRDRIIADADYSIKLVDDLINHPGMPDVVGGSFNPAGWAAKAGIPIPGTDAAGFMARLDQVGGRQFLQAYESLKGAGQITEVEGKQATNALSRLMKTGQTEAEYREAAKELKGIFALAKDRARGQGAGQTPQPTGDFKFLGIE